MKLAEVLILERARRLRETVKREGARAYLDGKTLGADPYVDWWKRAEWEAGWTDARIASHDAEDAP